MAGEQAGFSPNRIFHGIIEAFQRRDVPFALAIVGILIILLLPVPTFLLDMLLALSLAFSFMILMTVLYVEKPLQFNAFPTILLIAAMFRLSLNIASTRLILSEGHRGNAAAGQIIEAFGGFVMAGSVVIGAIVFAILTIINFIVITKGSGRIAEVGARFSLDAMPGKQMAIDADLGAGAIDDAEASRRREELQQESSFYGAMDGASKFVRGDAIAGLLITVINLIAGMIIGIVQRDLSFSQAAESYTMLTVGDGLISQIPSLIVSTAAGLLISKTGTSGTANKAITDQLSRSPESVALVSALMLFLAAIPSVPTMPFLILSGGAGFLAYRLYIPKIKKPKPGAPARPGAMPAAPAPAAPGQPAPTGGPAKVPGDIPAEDDTPVSDALKIDPILLELGYGLLPLVNYQGGTPLPQQIKTLRKRLAKEFGFVLPSVRIQDNMQLPHYAYVIRVKDIECARGESRPDKLLTMNPGGGPIAVAGEDTKEPAFGLAAKWIAESAREDAQFRSYTVVDPPTVITTHLTEAVKENVTSLLTFSETQKLLDEVAVDHSKLVGDTVPDKITVSGVQRVLQNLLAERISVRDLPSILEAILEASSLTQHIGQITEYVRRRMARQICAAFANPANNTLEALVLSPVWEQLFNEHMEDTPSGEKQVALPPARLQEFVAAVKRAYAQHRGKNEHPVMAVPPALRPHVRAILERALPAMPILSRSEIHAKAKFRTLGQI